MDENIIMLTPTGNTPNPDQCKNEKDIPSLSHINIKKFPYNGKEKNLIDKLLIIGYDCKFIEKEIHLIYEKNIVNSSLNSSSPIEITLNEVPSVINEICFDYSKEYLDDDLILEVLFPNSPLIYFIKTPNNKNTVFPSTNIVFSLNPFDVGNSKKSINGFGYQFYEIEKVQNSVVCFPKIICFLSEFPYFAAYHNLCQKILKLFKNNSLSFPIEALLYNIVTFMPSPINYGIDLSIWKVADIQLEEKIKKNQTSPGNPNIIMSPQNNILQPKQSKSDNTIFFPQLSGYPLFNFNLSMIFNILPVDIIMQVFFVTFLENDIIFYSSNLELLNLTMFIFSNLNYPCNDSIYFWHIVSVSPDNFMTSSSTFVGKTCSSMIGINAPYDPKLKTTLRIKEHFIIDLDNKYFTYVSESTSSETTRMKSLLDTLLKIVRVQNPTNLNEQGEISEALRTLYLTLTTFSKKFILMSIGVSGQKECLFNIETFKYDDMIAKHNKSIQEAFYTFIINVFNYYYSSFKLGFDLEQQNDINNINSYTQFSSSNKVIKSTIKNSSVYVEYHVEKETINDFEKDFHLQFKESSKFGAYIINFMLYYDTIDLFKIPLLFTEEFNSRMQFNKNESTKITNYLDIIDQLYCVQTPDDLYKISSQKGIKNNRKEINFNDFYSFSDKNIKADFLRHGMVSELFDRLVVGGMIRPCYKKCEIDTQYLLEYIYMINNLNQDELLDLFPMINLLEKNDIISFRQDFISDVVEQSLISQKSFEKFELIVYSIFNVFAATRGFCKAQDAVLEIFLLTDISNKTNYNLRKYLTRIINIYARFALKAANEENETERIEYIYCYRILVKYLQNNDILPNEELMALLNINSIKKSSNTTINYSTRGSEDPSFSGIKHRNHKLKPHFEYVNVDDYFLEKIKAENESNLWTLSDNLGFDGNITQPEVELIENDGNLKDFSSTHNFQQKEIIIKSTIEGRDDIPPLNIFYYSPKKLYTESSKLLDKYYLKLNNDDIDKEILNHLMWNLIYYIYLIQKIELQRTIDFPCEISKAFITIYEDMVIK